MIVIVGVLLLPALAILLYMRLGGPKLPAETDAIIDSVLSRELPELVTGETGLAPSGGLELWYERIPAKGATKGTVLLIMGMAGNALMWPRRFVRALVEAGYDVVRYDHRDTGLSSRVEGGQRQPVYAVADMAGDALAVLDALGIERAHLVGLSLGGMIAQELAIQQPQRVASLALIMTSGYIGDPELPGPTSRYFLSALVKGLPLLKYRLAGGERNLLKEPIAKAIVASGYEGLDIRELAGAVLYDVRQRKGVNLKAIVRHQAAIAHAGSRYDRLSNVRAPALVVHGTADELIPIAHGKKLAEILPNATGYWLDGVGHIFPPPDLDGLLSRLLAHLEGAGHEHLFG